MAKQYLFIGGPKDGDRICTNGLDQVRFPPRVDFFGEVGPDTVLSDSVYDLVDLTFQSGVVSFYKHSEISHAEAMQMLVDWYKSKLSLVEAVKSINESRGGIDLDNEPKRMLNFVEVGINDLVTAEKFFSVTYPTVPNMVIVFPDMRCANNAMRMRNERGNVFFSNENNMFYGVARWCVKGQEEKIYPEGE